MGGTLYTYVFALAVSGSDLYAGGIFTTAGYNSANYIAKWDGTNWSALGSGMDGTSLSLAVHGSDLYAAGHFTIAGGKVSPSIARAYLPTLPMLTLIRSGDNVKVSWRSGDTASFTLEQTGVLEPGTNWSNVSANISDDGSNKSVTFPTTNSAQFFRLRGR
jgi:hypothetical protein